MREGGFTAYSGLSARVPPDHTRIRKLVQGCFGARRFRAIEPQIREIVTKAIDAFAEQGHADFFREFAYDVPAFVLFKLVGVPDADVPKVKSWGVSRSLADLGQFVRQEQLAACPTTWSSTGAIAGPRAPAPRQDRTTICRGDLVRSQKDGAEISDDEIAGVLYSVLFAGHETTTTLMANGLRELLLHRDNWEALVADPVTDTRRRGGSPALTRPRSWPGGAGAEGCVDRRRPGAEGLQYSACCSGPPIATNRLRRSVRFDINARMRASISPSATEFIPASVSNSPRSSSRSRLRNSRGGCPACA